LTILNVTTLVFYHAAVSVVT